MVRLSRTVRFTVNPLTAGGYSGGLAAGAPPQSVNGFAGKPAMRGLGRYYELTVTCTGEPDPLTGYLINIKDVDKAAWAGAIPMITQACSEYPEIEPTELLPSLRDALAGELEQGHELSVQSVCWHLTPTYAVEMTSMQSDTAIIRQQFDFAAAHRLHVPQLSDEANRAQFGRCNNPSGHGHNYRVEVAVEVPTQQNTFALEAIERVTHETVIDPFDHTHLDEDRPEFGELEGVTDQGQKVRTSSVENIAKVFFDRLGPQVADASGQAAKLVEVTVWETDRTSCSYSG